MKYDLLNIESINIFLDHQYHVLDSEVEHIPGGIKITIKLTWWYRLFFGRSYIKWLHKYIEDHSVMGMNVVLINIIEL